MTRKYIDSIFWGTFVAVLIGILWFKPDWLPLQTWLRFIWVVAFILLVPTVFYLLARWRFPDAFPDRIRIRPFIPLDSKTLYNGAAIARLLDLEMQTPELSKEARSRVGPEQSAAPVEVKIAGTSIPLDFIWSRVDQWLFGPISFINGIVAESEGRVTLQAWSNGGIPRWRATSSMQDWGDPLRSAICFLADAIRDEFGHNKELRDKYEKQHRFDLAIYYCERLNKKDQGADLAYLYFNAGRIDDAERAFECLLKNSGEEVSAEARRGLALVSTARGDYKKALDLLRNIHGDVEARAKLDEATVLCYTQDFAQAINVLEKLARTTEASSGRLLGGSFFDLSIEATQSKLTKLKDKDWLKAYNDLWNLAELYGTLGRCYGELGHPDEASQTYSSAIKVLYQLSAISQQPYHQVALDLGVRFEDLGLYDNAMESYNECLEDAEKAFREDPEDVFALTDIAWAYAGSLACSVKKLNEELQNRTNNELRGEVERSVEELGSLLRDEPDEVWRSVFVDSDPKQISLGGSNSLSEERAASIRNTVAELTRTCSNLDGQSLRLLIENVVNRDLLEVESQKSFTRLLQKGSPSHIAEALFGFACVDAIRFRSDRAVAYVGSALNYAPYLRNRARLDEDLRVFRGNEGFEQLLQWENVSLLNDQELVFGGELLDTEKLH
jgi:tetratricopeptide (TPR) repeat protein